MKRRHVRPALWWLLIGVSLLGAAKTLAPPIVRAMQRRAVEVALARFEASPSQEDADELAALLAKGAASREQGERVLKAVLRPRITMRSAYPAGKLPFLALKTAFHVRFRRTIVSRDEGICVDGHSGGHGHSGDEYLHAGPRFYCLYPAPQKPGLYDAEVQCEYTVTRIPTKTRWVWDPRRGGLPWSLLPHKVVTREHPFRKEPDYTCHFNIPVQFNVVKEHEKEKIDLASNPELDARMRRAFMASRGRRSMSTLAGVRTYTCDTHIEYSVLPLAVAFRPALRLASGEEIAPRDERREWREWYRVRAGTSGEFFVEPPTFPVEAAGEYNATLILTPDLDRAYDDPAIKAIWGGTLEFPIHFTISAEDNVE